ncbi:MAG: lysophospholipid transporter LplT [Gammaproteobacteria bacterium]|nr:MAG: lysophospholipid transporter LplT [Gammaproteobacteria bacterium]
MIAVLIAQFLSALADNMLLFVILGLIKVQSVGDWATPVLQQTFLIAYIVLAPFVGAVADSNPKNRVMLLANTLKLAGVLLLLVGGNAFLAYGIVGIGACVYSPAKYGILKEITGEARLVKANAMIESSTIVAILVGVVLGGLLADKAVSQGTFVYAFLIIAATYLLASISNLYIPHLKPERNTGLSLSVLFKNFVVDFKVLWSDFTARVTLMGTSLFFGVGTTLRIWLIAWVPLALGTDDNQTPAILNAAVGLGIVVGSGIASQIPLSQAHRVLSAGIGMGIGTILLSTTSSLYMGFALLTLTGICGGIFLVPLNALLQNQGHNLVGGGHAVAIQNFVENAMMLLMLSVYLGLVALGLSAITIGFAFGGLVIVLMLALRLYARRRPMS